eukprot:scpid61856/ scgid5056/ UPF0672 protein C3orf58
MRRRMLHSARACYQRRRCSWRCMISVLLCSVVLTVLFTREQLQAAISGTITQHEVRRITCPACFGEDFCPVLARFQRRPDLGRKYLASGNGVHKGILARAGDSSGMAASTSPQPPTVFVIGKSLAYGKELATLNGNICMDAKARGVYNGDCTAGLTDQHVGRIALQAAESLLAGADWHGLYNMSHAEVHSISHCVGDQLHKKIVHGYDGDGDGRLQANEAAMMRTNVMVNHEAVVLKAFPSSDGWPFPRYYGACGRMIFVEDSGAEMGDYMDAPWTVRVRVAKALVDTTIKLTDNAEQWIFHLLDVEEDNFAVHYNSTLDRYVVTLIDLEHMIIVNKNDPVFLGEFTSNDRVVSVSETFAACAKESRNCQVVFPAQLCAAGLQDTNYYYICRNLLYADHHWAGDQIVSWTSGLLHDPPDKAVKQSLTRLANECILNNQGHGRLQAYRKLSRLLSKLGKSP